MMPEGSRAGGAYAGDVAPSSALSTCMLHAQLWERDGRSWGRAQQGSLKCDAGSAAEEYMELLLQGRHSQLADFDDHLNDVAKCANLDPACLVSPEVHAESCQMPYDVHGLQCYADAMQRFQDPELAVAWLAS